MPRPPRRPRSERGREILTFLSDRGLSIASAARKASISFSVLFNIIHRPSSSTTVGTATRLIRRLELPLRLVAPGLALALEGKPEPTNATDAA
jgi:hypothetical protein